MPLIVEFLLDSFRVRSAFVCQYYGFVVLFRVTHDVHFFLTSEIIGRWGGWTPYSAASNLRGGAGYRIRAQLPTAYVAFIRLLEIRHRVDYPSRWWANNPARPQALSSSGYAVLQPTEAGLGFDYGGTLSVLA